MTLGTSKIYGNRFPGGPVYQFCIIFDLIRMPGEIIKAFCDLGLPNDGEGILYG